jgi:hypothetical protein
LIPWASDQRTVNRNVDDMDEDQLDTVLGSDGETLRFLASGQYKYNLFWYH